MSLPAQFFRISAVGNGNKILWTEEIAGLLPLSRFIVQSAQYRDSAKRGTTAINVTACAVCGRKEIMIDSFRTTSPDHLRGFIHNIKGAVTRGISLGVNERYQVKSAP